MGRFDNILTAVCRRRLLPVKSVAINISLEEWKKRFGPQEQCISKRYLKYMSLSNKC